MSLATSFASTCGRTLLAISISALATAVYAAPRTIDAPALADVITTPVGEVKGGTLRIPMITWGGDIATIHANGGKRTTQKGSLLDRAGIQAELFREDDFKKQVSGYLSGETPFLRGTVGMINTAADLLSRDPRTKPQIIYQLTWSNGGDALVVKDNIKTAADLKGKTVAIQAYGPHVAYLNKVLLDAGLTAADVNIRWLPDLTGTDDTPMAALYENDVDAAFVIIPDALALTSGGNTGSGAEDSVRGARILLSTRTANRVIADVYAVRSDWYKANASRVEAFVGALLTAQDELQTVVRERASNSGPYQSIMAGSAELLLDSAQAIADTEGLYADCEFAGFDGQIKFFTDANNPRRLERLNKEVAGGLIALGLATGSSLPAAAGINYPRLKTAVGSSPVVEQPRFEQDKVAAMVTRRQQQGSLDEGEIFSFEVYFKPNQNSFSADLYADAFTRAIELAATYGGAIITIEGHSDPLGYLRKKKAGETPVVLRRIKQSARNLSMSRAQSVRDTLIQYAGTKSIDLDASQFAAVGHGIAQPATGVCGSDPCAPKNETEWRSNMRVQFRLIQVEAEENIFKPL